MSIEVIITLVGLTVAGLAAVLGIWMERDKNKPPRYAYALSLLILLATAVGMFQTYMDSKENEKMEGDMARMIAMLDKIASEHGEDIPELNDMVKTEIAAQSRANPRVVAQVAQRVADDGRDPMATLARALPAAEMQDMQRKGRFNVSAPALAMRPNIRPDGSAGAPRMVLRLPAAGASDAPAPEAAASAPASAVACASAAPAASIAPLRIPGGMRRPGGGDKGAPAGDKPPSGPKPARAPKVGGGN